jgi:hypothetical protein
VLPTLVASLRRFFTILGEMSTAVLSAFPSRFSGLFAVLGEISRTVLPTLLASLRRFRAIVCKISRVLILSHLGRILSVVIITIAVGHSENDPVSAFL